MFPPASLSFDEAVASSVRLRTLLKRPWLVGNDLVLDIPSAQLLAGSDPMLWGYTQSPRLCILATAAPQEVIATCETLLRRECNSAFHYVVATIETRLPTNGMTLAEAIDPYFEYCQSNRIILAIEPNLSGPDWLSKLEECLTYISSLSGRRSTVALKIRCSGETSVRHEQLYHIIDAVSLSGAHLKATGGLHHPLIDPIRWGNTFGFLNLAAAVMFRRALGSLFEKGICNRLLQNGSPEALTFGAQMRFEEIAISAADLVNAKSRSLFSIGSCSLSEPDQDLAQAYNHE
jgi:hypothetical protein